MAAVSPPPNSTASPVPPALFPPSSPPLVSSLPSSPPQASLPPSTPPPASPPPPSISPASPPPASPPASPPPSTLPPASPPPPTPPPASPPPPFISPASPPPASPPASPPPSTPPPASPPPSTPPPASPPPSTPPPASPPPARASPPASSPQSTPPVFPPPSSISPASPPPASPPASPPPSTPPLASPAPSTPPSASSSPPPPATPASPPPSSPGVASPPPSTPASPPPLNEASPASSPPAPPPQSPPTNVTSPPLANSPPSSSTAPPPEPANTPPPASSPSPPGTPTSAPPPPSPVPPSSSPAPPSTNPPVSSSPPPSVNSPSSSPPPPLSSHENAPPKSPPPSPSPSPVTNPPRHPPPPASGPPNKSPPPPASPPTKLPTPPSSPSVVSPPSNFPPTFPPPPPISLSSPSPSTSPSLPSLPLPSSDANNNINTASNSSSSNGGRGIGTGGIIAIGLIFGFVLIGCVGLAVWCICKQKKRGSGPNNGYVLPTSVGSSAQPDSALVKLGSSANDIGTSSGKKFVDSPTDPGGLGNSRSWFTYEELVQATDGFAAQNFLGEGGFGSVYKGTLADGRVVAVKQLKIGGGQGEREFKAEIEIISRINHRNLVSLVGYCVSESRRMLVYDYVPNNTLYFHLHGEGRPVMDWAMRVKVAVGAARGIAYLHEDCIPRIVHRDIKSSNILLDDNFEARVSDFGLAKLFQLVNTHVTTRVMGTFGYMAPEYAASGKLTEKSDVFSFGVVLLELITGRKPVDASQPLGDESLVEWARPLLSHALESQEFEQLVDPRLERNYVDAEMFRLIEVAAACVRHSSAKRPQMGQVVRAFDTMSTWDITNGMRVGESEIFNSAQQSEEIRLFQRMAFGNQAYSADFFTGSSFISRLETFKASQLDAQNTI